MLVHSTLAPRPARGADLSYIDCDPLAEAFGHGVRLNYARNAEIFAQGDSADLVYRVVSGVVRLVRSFWDGRRQVSDFLLPEEVFGLEAETVHRHGAEAVGPAVVLAVRRASLTGLATDDWRLGVALWTSTVHRFQRAQDHILMLGRQGACERMCAFLLDMSERLGGECDQAILPMSRQDMADYLGLTIETVSRTLGQLQDCGWIALPSTRQVVLLNRHALERARG